MTEPWNPLDHVPEEFPRTEDGTKWAQKLWLNVPGPFYTGETDTCWTGRLSAPRHVLYGGPHLAEFVYRQPKTPEEVDCLVDAAWATPSTATPATATPAGHRTPSASGGAGGTRSPST